MAAVTFAERFVRAYAERAVKSIEVSIDHHTGVALLTFHARHAQVDLRDLVMQEEAFKALAVAVEKLLGIPDEERST